MDPKIEEAVFFVYSYAPEIVEWKILKKELLKFLSADYRRLFSRRDEKTKKMNFNDFEKTIVEMWNQIAGASI